MIMKRILYLIGLVAVISCPLAINAQTYNTYKELPEVKIDYTVQQCGAEPNVISEMNFIRLTNKTTREISVSFKIEYYYNGVCTTCNTGEYFVTYKIAANQSITTDCDNLGGGYGNLGIIKRYVNRNFGHPLDRFELTNISVQ